jgi:hypothetical protein
VATLAAMVCCIIVAVIIHAINMKQPINEGTRDILANIITSVVAIVSMYVGASIQKGRDK